MKHSVQAYAVMAIMVMVGSLNADPIAVTPDIDRAKKADTGAAFDAQAAPTKESMENILRCAEDGLFYAPTDPAAPTSGPLKGCVKYADLI